MNLKNISAGLWRAKLNTDSMFVCLNCKCVDDKTVFHKVGSYYICPSCGVTMDNVVCIDKLRRFYNSIRDIYEVDAGNIEMIIGVCDEEFLSDGSSGH